MKAVVQDRYGSADVLELRSVDEPVAGDGDVLVRVRAAAVNPGDCYLMRGVPLVMRPAWGMRGPRRPVLGWDAAGTVTAVGAGVTRFRPGDEVFGTCRSTFAEYAVGGPDTLAAKPPGLTFAEAAAVPTAAVTALRGLRDAGRVRAGQRVLVNGASGGVGTFAVQLAKVLGAEVTGVCSTRNVELVRSLGADHVVDYAVEDFTRGGRRYDVILDNVANHPLSRLRGVLAPRGVLLPNSGAGGRWFGPLGRLGRALALSAVTSRRARAFVAVPKHDDLAYLAGLLESGQVRAVIDRTYPLGETADAVRHVETGHARGKVVIAV
jgi:NADPH:quinone reductase-like Zn-dependent oxidoreductase